MTICIRPKRVGIILAVLVVCVTLAYALGQFLKHHMGFDNAWGLGPQFDLDGEANLSTWYASSTLFLAAVLLGVITCLKKAAKDSFTLHWAGLCALFVFMSASETARIHEQWPAVVATSTYVVVPGVPIALFFVVVYLRFLLHLPAPCRYLFCSSGFLFTLGAAGMEMVEQLLTRIPGSGEVVLSFTVGIEESLEMVGVALFIYSLFFYLKTEFGTVQVKFQDTATPP